MAEQTRPGRLVGGRYRLEEALGGGGFGRVWRAHDQTLDVDVAVKEVWLPPAASETEHAQRLVRAEREARNAAKLRSHPHVVAVHDVVIEEGAPWIVMELVEGANLADRLAENGPMPVADVARIAGELLEGLGAAHKAGIVHRDVKPTNVMLALDGRALLADFGIAVHKGDTAVTTTGGLIGSLEYMAPERFDGVDSGGAGDLYSLGVTLYQALEGVSPFHRDTPTETLTAVVLGQAPAPQRAGRLEPLITRLLDKNPANRPTVAQAQAVIDGAPSPRERPGEAAERGEPADPGGSEEPQESQELQVAPISLEASEAPTRPVPPAAPTLPLPPPPEPSPRRPRALAIAGAAVAVAAVIGGIVAITASGNGDAPDTGASRTPPSSSAPDLAGGGDEPGSSSGGSGGITTEAGCENLSKIMEKWDRIVTSNRYGNGQAPIEDLLREIQDLEKANIAKATAPAVESELQKDLAGATRALNAYRSGDEKSFNNVLWERASSGSAMLRACHGMASRSPS
ncbi:serine/threonine-protein kinase [Streptomyces sp. BP-8]|uniref:non-specific serine/threonine protein kinase n=1 Tax=Streptomyces sirii TaxID=3127701 RepID=A0ABZ2QE67_9ACTN